jgi:hypothetical protein
LGAAAVNTGWFRASVWFAIALIGNAAVLQSIGAGTLPRFQHYRGLGAIPGVWHWVVLSTLVLQVIAVMAGAVWMLPLAGWLRALSSRWRVSFAVLAVMGASAAFVGRDIRAYIFECGFFLLFEAVSLVNILLIAWSMPPGARWTLKSIWVLMEQKRAAAITSIFVVVITSFLSYFVYQHHPHIPDEVSYVIHARYLSQGHLTMSPEPAPDAFRLDLITYESSRWYSPFPIGWPLMLAIGVWAGMGWLVNPLLAGVCTYFIWLFIGDFYDKRAAATSLPLLATSPWFLFMGMSMMSHIALLVFTIMAMHSALRARSGGSLWWTFGAGCCTGFASVIRPFDGFILAVLIGSWLLIRHRPWWSMALKGSSAFAASCTLFAALSLPYNHYLTGRALKFPVDDYFDRVYWVGVNSLGFGSNKGLNWPIDPFPGHGLRDVVVNTALNVASTNVELLGWATGSLLPIIVLMLLGPTKRDRLMLVPLAVIPAAFSLYWYHGGPEFGARYWFLIFPFCIALVSRGVERLRAAMPDDGPPAARMAVIALCLITLIAYVPWRSADKYYHYLRMSPDVLALAKEHNFGRSLVIIRGHQHPDYASAAVYNSFDLSSGPIYAWEASPEARAHAIAAFPDRPVWVVNGPSITGGRYEVSEGPLTGTSRLAKR